MDPNRNSVLYFSLLVRGSFCPGQLISLYVRLDNCLDILSITNDNWWKVMIIWWC